MSEDYTWDGGTVTDWRRQAQDARQYALGMEAAANEQAARVAELERALAQADSNMVALAARNAELAARLAAVPVEALRKLRAHLSDDGEYSICRTDKESMFWGDVIMFGGLFETIGKWLDTPQVQP